MGLFKRSSTSTATPKPNRADLAFSGLVSQLQAAADPVTKIKAIWKLAEVGGQRAVPPLLQTMRSTWGGVRMESARSLLKLGWKPSISADKAAVLAVDWPGNDPEARIALFEALSFAREGNAPILIHALVKEVGLGAWDGHNLRAVRLLGEIGTGSQTAYKALLNPLRRGRGDDERGQIACAKALGWIGDEGVAQILEELIQWDRPHHDQVRKEVREAIEQIRKSGRTPGAVPSVTVCASCGRPLGADEMQKAESSRVLERAMGDAAIPGAAKRMPDVMAGTAMKCDRCALWVCNDCVVRAALSAEAGMIMHANCGGFFENPD